MYFLYIINDISNHIKVGITKDLSKRMNCYKTHNPTFKICEVFPLDKEIAIAVELSIKRKFKRFSIIGRDEWFSINLEEIKSFALDEIRIFKEVKLRFDKEKASLNKNQIDYQPQIIYAQPIEVDSVKKYIDTNQLFLSDTKRSLKTTIHQCYLSFCKQNKITPFSNIEFWRRMNYYFQQDKIINSRQMIQGKYTYYCNVVPQC